MKKIFVVFALMFFVQVGQAQFNSGGFVTFGGGGITLPADSVTGTGKVVRQDSPTLTTKATIPIVVGGTGTTSTLILKPTSGVGATGANILFRAGNNGATNIADFNNSGAVNFYQSVVAFLGGLIECIWEGDAIHPTANNQKFGIFGGGSASSRVTVYGSTNATPDITEFKNNSAITMTISKTGFVEVADSFSVGNIPTVVGAALALGADGKTVGQFASRRELKENIRPLSGGLFSKINSWAFRWKMNGQEAFGFISNELDSVDARLVIHDKDGKPTDIDVRAVLALTVSRVQELEQRLALLEQSSFPNPKEVSVMAAIGIVGIGFIFWMKHK